jgi:hypothetical protein
VVVVVVVSGLEKSRSRMSDLKKCRLGNLSNKGKLLVRECCWMRILYKRPEDSMDYISRTLSFRTAPVFRRLLIHASSTARHEWSRVASQKLWRQRLCLQ